MTFPIHSLEGRRIFFYTLSALLLATATYATFFFWWPANSQGEVTTPTIITDAPPSAETDTPMIFAGTSSSSTDSAVVSLKEIDGALVATTTATVLPMEVTPKKSTGTTPSPTKATTKQVATPSTEKDTTPPSTPQNLTVQFVAHDEVVINWARSLDNVGVAGYKIFRDNELVSDTTRTIQIFIHLKPQTKYTFGVVAYDAVGNLSKMNNILAMTTADPGKETVVVTPPPSTPAPSPAVVAPPPLVSLCGNGIQNIGEECDDGNKNDHDMCTNGCKAARCGDGIVNDAIEQCDDGDTRDGDYCTNQCQNHTPTADQIRIWGLTPPTAPQ